MKLTLLSGRSGSGKTVSLRLLEDLGYYCVDNLPLALLPMLQQNLNHQHDKVAVSIDARSILTDSEPVRAAITAAKDQGQQWEVIYLDCSDSALLQRFSETRRKHPLTNSNTSLLEAIRKEKQLLAAIANMADLLIDTSKLTTHQLRNMLGARLSQRVNGCLAILFESFGYKFGIPHDADYVFDIRCLPNPYWEPELRELTGVDPRVTEFLQQQPQVNKMYDVIKHFLDSWIPHFSADNRSYLTVAIGCTGGRHRSVYMAERLAKACQQPQTQVQIRHRELLL